VDHWRHGGWEVKYISICSGIEAASTAWHGLGWTPLAFSEIEPFPSAVLAERWPQVPNLGDMSKYREWPEELLAECDLLVGGTPCQAFSVAGLRKSLDDERGNLSLIYVHLFHHINEVKKRHGRPPAIAVWENVPGVCSTKDNAFGCFISELLGVDETIETQDGKWPKAGFLGSETVRVGYRILDAQYFGVAQRRRRVFLVAVPCELISSLGERACPSEILSLRESLCGNPPTRGKAWEGVTGAVTARTGRNGGSSKDDVDSGRIVAFCNTAGDTALGMGVDGGKTMPPITSRHGDPGCIAFHPTQDPISSLDGSTHAMGCGSHGGCSTQAVAFSHSADANSYGTACVVEGTPPLRGGGAGNSMPAVASAKNVRRLTPRECERLQGFPDDYTLVTYRNKPAADGPRYRALGNSMAVPCMLWIGWRIHKATK
jgi:DNA (cytosine-5)-methyltransferase 1